MISQFTVHTNNCVCHKIRSLFGLRGMYNFGSGVEKSEKIVCTIQMATKSNHTANL
jgi:hypothetical protein